jgi:hypothetical protein
MKFGATLSLAVVLMAGNAMAWGPVRSGPQAGERTGGFIVQFLNGRQAGQRRCPV